MSKPIIGISIGDINGIGLEVILKTLNNNRLYQYCIPVLYGNPKVISYHKNIVGVDSFQFLNIRDASQIKDENKTLVISCWNDTVNITLGKPTDIGGKYAFKSLEVAVADLKASKIDALVTAPIHKKSMQLSGFQHPGHTEYITAQFGNQPSMMMMISDILKMGLVTTHVPLQDVAGKITKDLIFNKLQILNETLKIDFGIERPVIAVLGLNPHAGEDGMLGKEENEQIIPAIVEAKKRNIMALGPFAADGFFGAGQYKKFDAVLAMYHDQGLIPFKTLSFSDGVNYTAGLTGIRTSPDHGTAFDIAGKNEADPTSFRQALYAAIDIAKSRKEYTESHLNPVVKREINFGEDEVVE